MLDITVFLSSFCLELLSWSSILSELPGEIILWRWTDTYASALKKIKELVNCPQVHLPWYHPSNVPKYLVYDASVIGLAS